MKCLLWTSMQTVFKTRHFNKALNQEWSHVLIGKERQKGKKGEVNCLAGTFRSTRSYSKSL